MQYITTVYVTTVPNQRNELWLNFNTTYFTINSGNCAQVEGACLTDEIRGIKLFKSSQPTNDSSATRPTSSLAEPMKHLCGRSLRDALCPCCRGTRKKLLGCIDS